MPEACVTGGTTSSEFRDEDTTMPNPPGRDARPGVRLNRITWPVAGALLLVPAIAMCFDAGVHWTASDFGVAGAMLAGACAAYEVASRVSGDALQRAGFAVAIAGALALVWVNLAVGLVGDGPNPANVLFMGVAGVAVVAALLARSRTRAMLATVGTHGLVGIVAACSGWGLPHDHALHVLGVTLLFGLPWLASAALFRLAAHGHGRAAR